MKTVDRKDACAADDASAGRGDYTSDRKRIVGNPTVAEIVRSIKARRKQ